MGTKIDVVVGFKPLEKILKNDKLSDTDKIQMALEIIEEVLAEAEK